jgi:type IV pilus assembly protein PilV
MERAMPIKQNSTRRLKVGALGRGTKGIALIEALVGILIFTTGILGVVGLQAAMTREQGSAKSRADAAVLASELIGLMWADSANSLSANLANYATACTSGSCKQWVDKVAKELPGGTAIITTDAVGTATITISWTSPTDGSHKYVTSTSIR